MIRTMFFLLWGTVTAVVALYTLPGTLELLGLSFAALLPKIHHEGVTELGLWRVAVIVPAHNEELGIATCLQSLQAADSGDLQVEIWVVADNCSDGTAVVAASAGANVLERHSDTERGKGYALHFAFGELMPRGYDCFLIVDADTVVSPNFIVAAAGAMRAGADAVQARYVAANTTESASTRLMGFSLRAFNVVRPRGRSRMGLSAGILGNGFGLSRATVETVPYLAASVVEDLEYHLSLVRSGRVVAFVDVATVFGEMPVRGKGVETQRSRWEGGRLRMLFQHAPGLMRDLLRGQGRSLEPLLDLLLLPLAFHVVLLCVACISPLSFVRGVGMFGLVAIVLHLAVTMVIGEDALADLVALASAPFYILWKILLIPSLLRNARSNNTWLRTRRNRED